ncbi:hypothetical protein Pcinc_019986 [Petrolisthes cinctipes]|uniref:Uncharacterized protein n=1 Tax=Petrolisthes cinctipes TaxID=88211 RepID=A0AAE1FK74_PETCI|nr:hypothetical protein Pcinc_019986 [Petrolisthes cinctipes]
MEGAVLLGVERHCYLHPHLLMRVQGLVSPPSPSFKSMFYAGGGTGKLVQQTRMRSEGNGESGGSLVFKPLYPPTPFAPLVLLTGIALYNSRYVFFSCHLLPVSIFSPSHVFLLSVLTLPCHDQ